MKRDDDAVSEAVEQVWRDATRQSGAAEAERAAIVAWLRRERQRLAKLAGDATDDATMDRRYAMADGIAVVADAIEAGLHVSQEVPRG